MTFILASITPEEQRRLENAGIYVEDADENQAGLKRIWANKGPMELLSQEIRVGEIYFGSSGKLG